MDLSSIGIRSPVYINGSLCKYYKMLFQKCKKLRVNRGCSFDIASSYLFRPSKVTEHVTSRSVWESLKQSKRNLKKPNPNPIP